MKTFYYDKVYRLLLILLALLCIIAVVLGLYNPRGAVPMKLAAAVALAVLVYLVPACFARLQIDGNMIDVRALTGTRSLRLSEVDSVSVIKLKGRYFIMLLTESSYVSFSTVFSNFMLIKSLLKQHIPATAFEKLEQISESDALAANKRLILTEMVICLIFAALIVYFNFIR